jgi:hypothetical protein
MKRLPLSVPFSVVCLILLATCAQAQRLITSGQIEVEAIRGLDGLAVEVESDVTGAESNRVIPAIEKRLRQAGIPAVPASKLHAAKLLVTLRGASDVVMVRIRLMRFAVLDCEKETFFYTPMWERERIVKAADVVTGVASVVDLFATDYSSINRR